MNQIIMSQLPSHLWPVLLERKEREATELQKFKALSFDTQELKAEEQEGRISGSQAWKESRGETGTPKSQALCAVPLQPASNIPMVLHFVQHFYLPYASCFMY